MILEKSVLLKIDKDIHADSQLEWDYVQDSITILAQRRIDVEWIKVSRTQHGSHYYVKIHPPVPAETANRLQYLLGDDAKRVDFNRARIESGLTEWSKLFERANVRLRTIYRADLPSHELRDKKPEVFLTGR